MVIKIRNTNNIETFLGVAVVIKNEIYFYRNCKPYHKYTIQPTILKDNEECKLWQDSEDAFDLLKRLQLLSSSVGFVNLSTTSQQMLCLDECHVKDFFIKHKNNKLLKQASAIFLIRHKTCFNIINVCIVLSLYYVYVTAHNSVCDGVKKKC